MADFNLPVLAPARDLKISELPTLTALPSGEVWLVCVSGGVTQRILLTTLLGG